MPFGIIIGITLVIGVNYLLMAAVSWYTSEEERHPDNFWLWWREWLH